MDTAGLMKMVWKRILVGFYKWLRDVKGYQLPNAAESLADEWIEGEVQRLGNTVGTVASLFRSPSKDEPLQEEDDADPDRED